MQIKLIGKETQPNNRKINVADYVIVIKLFNMRNNNYTNVSLYIFFTEISMNINFLLPLFDNLFVTTLYYTKMTLFMLMNKPVAHSSDNLKSDKKRSSTRNLQL